MRYGTHEEFFNDLGQMFKEKMAKNKFGVVNIVARHL